MRSELSVGRLSLAGKSQNLSIQHTRLGWLITHAWLMGTRRFLFTVYMKTCTCTHTACTVHICSHVASRARTHTLARTPIKGNPEKKLKGRISLPSFTLPLYLKKNGGFEEALWSEVYHLRSLKTECGRSYSCNFINALKVESRWGEGKYLSTPDISLQSFSG